MTGDGEKVKESDVVDIYRDTPVRLLGYTNEVGESFRSLISVHLVNLSYAVAFGYCLADTIDKTIKRKKDLPIQDPRRKTRIIITAGDTLIWQLLASVLIPGFTINRICFASNILLRRYTTMHCTRRNIVTTAAGLSSIPLIVRPIDHLVDWFMDSTCRKIYIKD